MSSPSQTIFFIPKAKRQTLQVIFQVNVSIPAWLNDAIFYEHSSFYFGLRQQKVNWIKLSRNGPDIVVLHVSLHSGRSEPLYFKEAATQSQQENTQNT